MLPRYGLAKIMTALNKSVRLVLVVAVLVPIVVTATTTPSPAQTPAGCNREDCKGALFVGYGEVVSDLPMKQAERWDGGGSGGECFEYLYTLWIWNHDTGVFEPEFHVDPCGYEVFCFHVRLDVLETNVAWQRFADASFRAGIENWYLLAEWARDSSTAEFADKVIQLRGCRVSEQGVMQDEWLGGLEPWGESYTPTHEWIDVDTEATDPTATAEELWALIERPDIEFTAWPAMGGAGSIDWLPEGERGSGIEGPWYIKLPSRFWFEDDSGVEIDPVISLSSAGTAALVVRAVPTEVVLRATPRAAGLKVLETTCLVEALERTVDMTEAERMDPSYGCNLYVQRPGLYDIDATVTYYGEQTMMTRGGTTLEWPPADDLVWDQFIDSATGDVAQRDVDLAQRTVRVMEIVSQNVCCPKVTIDTE